MARLRRQGIGASIVRALAGEGASVVVNYSSSKQDADHVVAEISRGGGNAIAVQGNVSRQADVQRLFSNEGANSYTPALLTRSSTGTSTSTSSASC